MKNKEIHVIYGKQPGKMVYEILVKMDAQLFFVLPLHILYKRLGTSR